MWRINNRGGREGGRAFQIIKRRSDKKIKKLISGGGLLFRTGE